MNNGIVLAVIQARMGSARFPEKVVADFGGSPLVVHMYERAKKSKHVDYTVVAIPESDRDSELAIALESRNIPVFFGSNADVQMRFISCAEAYGASTLVRLTADCPLIDWNIIDDVIIEHRRLSNDYTSNTLPPSFPDGLDVEVFQFDALVKSRLMGASAQGVEHVTYDLRLQTEFSKSCVRADSDFSHLRWTVDYKSDLREILLGLPPNHQELGWLGLLEFGFLGVRESIRERNEGLLQSSGQKIWERAKRSIPGGSMLLSKRAEMFLPNQWPSYYSKAKGIEVTDLDGRTYLDFATMSVGTCSLGYGNTRVDSSVKAAIDEGVMSTLNSPAEVELAERITSLHPWSDMARFARSGGEANAIAVRIARAKTGKEKIAICGYHGWHDWYLAANLDANSNLDGHLLPGLDPAGVPRSLLGTAVPFNYNDARALESLLRTGEFAAVQMEVSRSSGPDVGFLEEVRSLCNRYGALLIFDECTSGFRETFGGLHLKFGVDPDLAMFGKAIGNGYAITAVIGREEVMQSAQASFISSTFWTERLGPVAALATLEEMESQKSWEVIPETGRKVKEIWSQSFGAQGVDVSIGGLDALPTFAIEVQHWPVLRTLFIQELLRRGFLATSGFYSSTAHDPLSLGSYADAVSEVAEIIAHNFSEERALGLLEGPVAQTGFKRLN